MMSENDQDLANPNPDLESNDKTEFPEGLRVLAVDDNLVCLKLIVTLLVKCRYKVTATTKPTEALDMLRKNKESYDLVITDVEMLDMDGFQLLQIIGIEMDVPVIRRKARSPRLPGEAGPDRGAQEHLAACSAVPKKILEVMDVPGLSRENVASHLQKFKNLLKKDSQKSEMNLESENNIDSSNPNRHISDLTTLPSNNLGLNNIGNPGMAASFGNRNQTFSAYLANRRPLHQKCLLVPQVADQVCPNVQNPVFGSLLPSPIPTWNPFPRPELNGMRLHSHVPRSFSAGQTSPSTMPVGLVPYLLPPDPLNLVQMLGDGSTQLSRISQPDPLAMLVPSSSQGQNERRNLVNFNGRGETSGFTFEMRGQIKVESTRNGQFVQNQPSENTQTETNGNYNNCSSPDDDLSAMIRQVRDIFQLCFLCFSI
ncbi:response regulator 12 [Actinidia rufa]|uniref:Response regulator 12 n=1 Tax=Actinidia rufa TaxID=165716 RepID=A0A7J0E2G8_9ERIC|nr:response regulator 12 [Actinidia rufa]